MISDTRLATPVPRATANRPAPASASQHKARKAWQAGVDLVSRRQYAEARQQFKRAVEHDPHDALYWLNLSRCCVRLHLPDEALTAATQALTLDPDSLLAVQMVARLHRDRAHHDEALAVLLSLPAEVPKDPTYHVLLGATLADLGRTVEASQTFLEALTLKPDHEEAYMQLGFNLAKMRRHADAAECFRTVLAFRPQALDCALYAVHYAAWGCDWPAVDRDRDALADCIDRVDDQTDCGAISPFCLLSISDDPHLQQAMARWDMRRFDPLPAPMTEGAWPREPGQRLRVGMVSCDFHHHATSMLMVDLLETLDRAQIELYLFSHGPDDGSALRSRVVRSADHFIECRGLSTRAQAELIRDHQIDVLVDLKGYTMDTRISVFSYRPAPVQVAWLGYPGSCGAPFIDYVVGDPVVTPFEAQSAYTECIAQLPVCYQPNDRTRARTSTRTRAECGLPDDKVVLASFNQSYKINRDVFDTWCRVLRQVPDSVLWVLTPDEPVRQKLRAEAQARGLDPARLIFAGFEPIEQHRLRIGLADLHLDTFPCGGHTTCSDALWGGVPTVAIQGQTFASRVAPSLLRAVGCEELICHDLAQYEALAVALARDGERRQALRQRLEHARDTAPLYDTEGLAHDLVALFQRMHERRVQGLAPAPLQLPAH